MNRIWSYLFTTADPSVLESIVNTSDAVRDFDTQVHTTFARTYWYHTTLIARRLINWRFIRFRWRAWVMVCRYPVTTPGQ